MLNSWLNSSELHKNYHGRNEHISVNMLALQIKLITTTEIYPDIIFSKLLRMQTFG